MRRIAGLFWHPRSTMAEVVQSPAFIPTWIALLVLVTSCGGLLLSTRVGRQALVDERVRIAESLGDRVDDAAYAAWQARPPYEVYLTSGGRVWLFPAVTVLVAAGLVGLAALDGASMRYSAALAVSVYASLALAVQQLVATPISYVRESLSSATTLASLLPVDEGTWGSRALGAVDVFGIWWLMLLAFGLSAATGRPARRYLWRVLAAYAGVAAVAATVVAVLG